MTSVSLHKSQQLSAVDSEALLTLLRKGSSAGYELLCAQYEHRLFRVALRIVRNDADAEDVVQDTLLKAFTKIASFRGDAAIYTWLVRIATNSSLMVLRKRVQHPTTSLDHSVLNGDGWIETVRHPGQDAECVAIGQQQSEVLRAAVQRLPCKYKFLMQRWLTTQISVQELSAEFGLTAPATKSRLLRGRRRLVHVLQDRSAQRVSTARGER